MPATPTRAVRQRLDLTDRRFGLLVAKERLPKIPGTQGERWRCTCDCGRETSVRVKDLTSANTRSCGHLTNRARASMDQPHRAGDDALYPAIRAEVFEVLRAGGSLRAEGVRRRFDGQTSRSTLYRFIRQACRDWKAEAAPGAAA